MPKYLRSQEDWNQELQKQDAEELGEDRSFERQSIEDLLNYEAQTAFKQTDAVNKYEPVLYEIVNDPVAANKDREGLTAI